MHLALMTDINRDLGVRRPQIRYDWGQGDVMLLLLDFSKSFDCVNHRLILHRLMPETYKLFLSDRSMVVYVHALIKIFDEKH
jgi:hypothetical protein